MLTFNSHRIFLSFYISFRLSHPKFFFLLVFFLLNALLASGVASYSAVISYGHNILTIYVSSILHLFMEFSKALEQSNYSISDLFSACQYKLTVHAATRERKRSLFPASSLDIVSISIKKEILNMIFVVEKNILLFCGSKDWTVASTCYSYVMALAFY